MIKSSSEDRSVIRRRPWCLLPGVLRSYLWTLLRFAYCNLIGFMEKFCRFELKCLQWSVWLLSSTSLGTLSWSLLHRQSCWILIMLANVWWTFKTTLTPNRFQILIWTALQFSWLFPSQIRDVVGNNPDIFLMNWSDIRKTMGFLESTMNVSARRVSITPASLTHPLEFYQTRYQVLWSLLCTNNSHGVTNRTRYKQ